ALSWIAGCNRSLPEPAMTDSLRSRKKILLVDDSKTALMIEKMLLGKASYDVITAADGHEGVQMALREKPDLILMDVVMPTMTGLQACRVLRTHEQTKTTPIILVTTRGEKETVEEGYASGCNDYVTKPINGLELLSKLRDQLGQ
ncbi:MAG: response regulator, partial [Polyangiaceae bacterium]